MLTAWNTLDHSLYLAVMLTAWNTLDHSLLPGSDAERWNIWMSVSSTFYFTIGTHLDIIPFYLLSLFLPGSDADR